VENHVEPENVESDVVEFAKALRPEKVLLFARSVEDAAVRVKVPPAVTGVELMVAKVPERSEVPMVVVDTTFPLASVERRAEVRAVK